MTHGGRGAAPADGRADPAALRAGSMEALDEAMEALNEGFPQDARTDQADISLGDEAAPHHFPDHRQAGLSGGTSKTAAQRGDQRWAPGPDAYARTPGNVWRGARARMRSIVNTDVVAAQLARLARSWRTQRLAERDGPVARSAVGRYVMRDAMQGNESAECSSFTQSGSSRISPLSNAILAHIAVDCIQIAELRSAVRALSQKSQLTNTPSIASNEVALAAALLRTDRSAARQGGPH